MHIRTSWGGGRGGTSRSEGELWRRRGPFGEGGLGWSWRRRHVMLCVPRRWALYLRHAARRDTEERGAARARCDAGRPCSPLGSVGSTAGGCTALALDMLGSIGGRDIASSACCAASVYGVCAACGGSVACAAECMVSLRCESLRVSMCVGSPGSFIHAAPRLCQPFVRSVATNIRYDTIPAPGPAAAHAR